MQGSRNAGHGSASSPRRDRSVRRETGRRQSSTGATQVVCSRQISLQPLMPPILMRSSASASSISIGALTPAYAAQGLG